MSKNKREQAELQTVEKVDLRKQFASFYNPPANEVEIVEVPPANFLMVDGEGNPNTSQEYKDSIQVLYSMSYTLKFALKKERHVDYEIMPLEGLWHSYEPCGRKPIEWTWTSMIMQPDLVTGDMVEKAIDELERKKNLTRLGRIRFERFDEGLSAQIMHIGPYSAEEATIKKLHEYILEKSFQIRGDHHEIYLGDPRRASPSKLRTVLRQPLSRS